MQTSAPRRAGIRAIGSVTIGLFLSSAALAAAALPAANLEWRHYQSPNFELYSTQSDGESRALLHNLELLRTVVFARFKIVERTRLDVTVFAFARTEHFTAYLSPALAQARVAAFYTPFPDRAVICIGPGAVERPPLVAGPLTLFTYITPPRHVIFHEYIHHLFCTTNQQPTVWFNEGFAELLATIEVKKNHIEIGHANPPTLVALQNQKLLPWESIFGPKSVAAVFRDHHQSAMFYAQSWAFLHYLYFGEPKPPPERAAAFMRVMSDRRSAAKVNAATFFQKCFGYDFAELTRRVDKYVANGKYHFGRQALPNLPAPSTYATRLVTPEERNLRLAELAARVQRSGQGKLMLLEAAGEPSAEARVHETLGSLALLENDPAGAIEHWRKAVELGTHNLAIARELTLLECRALFTQFDYDFRLPPARAAELRERLLATIQQEPAQTAGYEMLALVEAFSAEPNVTNVNLVQDHFKQLSEKQRTVVALAIVRLRMNNPMEATRILDELPELPPDPVATRIAAAVRARLTTPTGRE